MFIGKESSNRIKLSRLVQELLNFGVFGSLQLWGVRVGGWGWGVRWVDGGGGCPPHTCTCMCMHTHACGVNMIISCKWPPPLGESLGIPYDVRCTCMRMHACACAWNSTLRPPLTHIDPPPIPPGGPPESVKIQ